MLQGSLVCYKEIRCATRKSGRLQGNPVCYKEVWWMHRSPVCYKEVRCAARKSGVLQGSPVGCKGVRCATKKSGVLQGSPVCYKEVRCAARSPVCCKEVQWLPSVSTGQAPERGAQVGVGVDLPKGLAGRSCRVDKSAARALGSAPSSHMHKTQSLSMFIAVVSFLTQCPVPRLRMVVSFLRCSMLVWPCCWLIVAVVSRLPLGLVFCF